MTISLPEPLKQFIDQQVSAGAYASADAHRSGCFFDGWTVQLRRKGGRSVAAELLSERALGADFFLNLFAVIVVVRACGVNVRECDGGNVRDGGGWGPPNSHQDSNMRLTRSSISCSSINSPR